MNHMPMMGSSRKRHDLLDFLSNPNKAKATIDAHRQATIEHSKAAEFHKKTKADALKVIEELTRKQVLHDEAEARLEARQKTLDDLSGKLNAQIADYNFKHKEVDDLKTELQRQKADQHHILQRMTNDILAKDQDANQKHMHLEQQLMSVAQQRNELSKREASVIERENSILAFANQLKGE